MKLRLPILVVVPALAAPAPAATITISDGTDSAQVTTSVKVDNAWTWRRTSINAAECVRLGLPTACTRAQATALDAAAEVWNNNIDFLGKSKKAPSVVVVLKEIWLAEAQSDSLATIGPAIRDLSNPTNAQCAAVGLAPACTAAQVQDAICVAAGKLAGCIR